MMDRVLNTDAVAGSAAQDAAYNGNVALLTNFLPPYRIKVLELLQGSVRHLRIFLSVRMESNRSWQPDWGELDVTVQRNLSFSTRVIHPKSFKEDNTIHVPYDTILQLWRYRPDAVIAGEFGMRTAQAALYKCLVPRTKLIVWATLSEITERSRGSLRKILRRLILRVTDAVLVNGSSGARYIANFGYPRDRIHVVPQATDNDVFAGPASRPADTVMKLLYAGQLIERKGLVQFHEQLVKWCEAHPKRQIRWTLIGAGPLQETIRSWNRPPNYDLDLLAEIPYHQLVGQYHRADLFVLPTLADEWGLVVNEALIAGLPVLGSVYSQAVEDLVTDGANGWTFRPDHPPEIYEALIRALDCSYDTLNAMREKAIDTVKAIDSTHMKNLIVGALEATRA